MKAATYTVCTSAESVKFWAPVSRPGHQLHQLLGSCWVLVVGCLATVGHSMPAAVTAAALSLAARFGLCLQGDTDDNNSLADSERQCFADWLSSSQNYCPTSCDTFTQQVRSNLPAAGVPCCPRSVSRTAVSPCRVCSHQAHRPSPEQVGTVCAKAIALTFACDLERSQTVPESALRGLIPTCGW